MIHGKIPSETLASVVKYKGPSSSGIPGKFLSKNQPLCSIQQ